MLSIRSATVHTGAIVNRKIDQTKPIYHNASTPACVGAQLADLLGKDTGFQNDFITGAEGFSELLGANRLQLILLLREAGAGVWDPLGSKQWNRRVSYVWRQLARIEDLPALQKASLYDLSVCLANLSKANLQGANLERSRLWGCDLRGADFTGADLTLCDLSGSDLRGADFTGAHISGTRLGGTRREETILTEDYLIANLRKDLSSAADGLTIYER